ncbi:MAG: hypothetical protein ACYTGL_16515 [Planctomycetota bacterium]|jgi:hypothetical protein
MKARRGAFWLLIIACVAGCHIDGKHAYLRTGPELTVAGRPQLSAERVLTQSYRPDLPPSQVARAKLERWTRSTVIDGANQAAMDGLNGTQSDALIVNDAGSFSSDAHGHEGCETCQPNADHRVISLPLPPPASSSQNSSGATAKTTLEPTSDGHAGDDNLTVESPASPSANNKTPTAEVLPPPGTDVTRPSLPPAPAESADTSSWQPASGSQAPVESPQSQPSDEQQAARPDLQAAHYSGRESEGRLMNGQNTVLRRVTDASKWCQTLCSKCRAQQCGLQNCVDDLCDEVRLPPWMDSVCEQCTERVGRFTDEVRDHTPEVRLQGWRHVAREKLDQVRTRIGSMQERIQDTRPFGYMHPPTRLRQVNWSEMLDRTRSRLRLPSFGGSASRSNGRPPRKSDRWRDGWNGR